MASRALCQLREHVGHPLLRDSQVCKLSRDRACLQLLLPLSLILLRFILLIWQGLTEFVCEGVQLHVKRWLLFLHSESCRPVHAEIPCLQALHRLFLGVLSLIGEGDIQVLHGLFLLLRLVHLDFSGGFQLVPTLLEATVGTKGAFTHGPHLQLAFQGV